MGVDPAALAAATNFVHGRLLEAVAAQEKGKTEEALAHYQDAVTIACRTMRDQFNPFRDQIAKDVGGNSNTAVLNDLMKNRDVIRQFLNAEEQLLKQVGLDRGLVDAVVDRCIDFLESNPEEQNVESLMQAFAAAEYRVCTDAAERLTQAAGEHDKYDWKIAGRTAFRTVVGVTIIGANYVILGPVELFGQLSSRYGVSWLPTWKG